MDGDAFPCFEVVRGPDPGRVYRLFDGTTTIGRTSATADIAIEADGMSRRHAQVVIREAGKAKVVDLGSKHGTFMDDERIHASMLLDGVEVRFGFELTLRFVHLDIETIRERQDAQP